MRQVGFSAALALALGACTPAPNSTPPQVAPESTSASRGVQVNPSNIRRLRGDLPPGYEVSDVSGPGSPIAIWGFAPDWTADPPQCAALANPVSADSVTTEGLSGSGTGGIIYAVVATTVWAPVTLDPIVVADCGQWTLASARTTATVGLVEAPRIDGVATVGMATAATTVVEGDTETDSQVRTFSAYLGDSLAFVAVVTDPGSPYPQLPPEFGADLLVKTVSALRG